MGARRGAVIARQLTLKSDNLYSIPEEVGMTHGLEEDIFSDSSFTFWQLEERAELQARYRLRSPMRCDDLQEDER